MSATTQSSEHPTPDDSIYLDHNATTPVRPEVADVVRESSLRYAANPASQHSAGRLARRALEDARQKVGELLGARMSGMDADRVIFTSGGTEAANLAVFGLTAVARRTGKRNHFVTTGIEHPCVLEAADQLHEAEVEHLSANVDGIVEAASVRRALRPETAAVSVMLANNETGVVQPIAAMASLCADQGIAMHCDAAQAIGKLPVSFADLGLSAMSLAAHKFYGPLGIGALVLRHGVALEPALFGGHQQAGLRPGTETVALAVGLCQALALSLDELAGESIRLAKLRDQLEQALTNAMPNTIVIGANAVRLPNTSNIAFVGLNRQALLMALDQAGIACSSGSACASGSSEPSPALLAMGLKKELLESSIRFSLGRSTTTAEVDEACRRILSVCQRLR